MTPHQQKLKKLVDRLVSKTSHGSIKWKVLPDGKSVKANLETLSVEIRPDVDEDGQDSVRIRIFDEDGNEALTFDDMALSYRDLTGTRIFYYTEMEGLLDEARRSARGEAYTLNQVLRELGEDDDLPF